MRQPWRPSSWQIRWGCLVTWVTCYVLLRWRKLLRVSWKVSPQRFYRKHRSIFLVCLNYWPLPTGQPVWDLIWDSRRGCWRSKEKEQWGVGELQGEGDEGWAGTNGCGFLWCRTRGGGSDANHYEGEVLKSWNFSSLPSHNFYRPPTNHNTDRSEFIWRWKQR